MNILFYFIFLAARGASSLNQAFVVFFFFFFLGTAVKYLDIGIVCVLLLAALIFRVDCKI